MSQLLLLEPDPAAESPDTPPPWPELPAVTFGWRHRAIDLHTHWHDCIQIAEDWAAPILERARELERTKPAGWKHRAALLREAAQDCTHISQDLCQHAFSVFDNQHLPPRYRANFPHHTEESIDDFHDRFWEHVTNRMYLEATGPLTLHQIYELTS